jgi:hypothetical protein
MAAAWPANVNNYFVFIGFVRLAVKTPINFLNSINQLTFVLLKNSVLFVVRTEFLGII